VAVKVLRPELATATESERFLREARTLANLSHPNVVAVHEVGHGEGLYFFVMERVRGQTLAERLAEAPLSVETVRRAGIELLDALSLAHGESVVHRDIKPANIFVSGGRPLLADFGIARPGDVEPDLLTREGEWRGTPRYMAPEVLRGAPATPRSDLYSLGAVLFESVTGRAWDDAEYGRWKDVPPPLIPALRGALAPDPSDRHSDAESFQTALLPPPASTRRWLVPVVAAAVAVAGTLFITRDRSPPATGPVTVLVAPFVDVTVDGSLTPIADGLTDAVTTAVGTSPWIQPVGRFTAVALRGQDLDRTALRTRFDVTYMVEGAVRGTPEALRVSVVVTNAADGLERWSETFDLSGNEVLEAQDDVGLAVLRALEAEIGREETAPLPRSTTRNMAAFDAYRRARRVWMARHPRDLVEVAIPEFQRAVELDPEWALAWAGLADVYNVIGAYEQGMIDPTIAFEEARRASSRALDLAPGLPEALTARASVLWNADRDVEGAEALFVQAIEANPSYAPALQWYSILLITQGRTEEALARTIEAYQADVLSPVISTQLARHYYFSRRYQEASEQFARAVEMDSTLVTARLGLGMTLIQQDRLDEALAEFETARDLTEGRHAAPLALIGHVHARMGDPEPARLALAQIAAVREGGTYVPFEYDAVVHLGLNQPDEAIAALNQAVASGSNGPTIFHVDPFLSPLHGMPEFEALVDRVGVRPGETAIR
jgi:TolB-like protein/tetratricopeptide (TPR) repeat protein